jgi:tetratricopeptide (TPR) repeat protein
MAQISHALGLHDKALRYYNKAISISRDLSNRHILVIHYYNKAELLYKVGKTKQSARLGDEALKISEHIGWEEGTENLLILKYKIEKDTQGLEKMLEKKDQNPENTAVINYELFRINRQDKCRKKALRIFTRLYKSAPKFQYLKMMNELNWESSIS